MGVEKEFIFGVQRGRVRTGRSGQTKRFAAAAEQAGHSSGGLWPLH
jgi:hypothetical protein